MKSLICVPLAILLVTTQINAKISEGDEDKNTINEHIKECKKTHGMEGNEISNKLPEYNNKSCFYHCLAEKVGLMDSDGEITFDKYKLQHPDLPPKKLQQHMVCVDSATSADKCEKAQQIHECIKNKRKHINKYLVIKKGCLEQYDLSLDNLKKPWFEVPESKKCYFKCLAVKLGGMDEDGKFTIEEFKELNPNAPKKVIEKFIECTKSSEKEDACDSAKSLAECMHKHHHHHPDWKKFLDMKKECLEEFNLPLTDLKKPWFEVPEDKKCYFNCLAVRLEIMDKDGEITIDLFKHVYSGAPKHLVEKIEKCADHSKMEDPCDTAKALADCVHKKHRHGGGKKKYLKIKKECLKKFDLPMEYLRQRWFEVPEDKQCYYKCISVGLGAMNEEGEFTIQHLKNVNPGISEKMLEIIEDCAAHSKMDDPCESAKALEECVHDHREKKMEKYFHVKKECLKEFDLPKSNLRKWWFEVPEHKKCYYKCMSTKLGSMNEDGEFTIEHFKRIHPEIPPSVVEHLEECADSSKKENACDSAKALAECVHHKHHHKHSEGMKEFLKVKKDCLEKFDIPQENLHKWWFEVPESKKCYHKCISVNIGLMKEDGEFDIENYKAKHPKMPQRIIETFEDCTESNEIDDPCDRAKATAECIHNKMSQKQDKKQKFLEMKRTCLKQFDLPLDHLRKGHFEVPEDKKCYYKCMAVNAGSINADGEFTVDNFKQLHPEAPDYLVENLEECIEFSKKDDSCDTARALSECMHKRHHDKHGKEMEKYFDNKKACLTTFDLPMDNLRKWWFDVPNDKKCYYKCMSVKSGVMNDAGEFTLDEFKSHHPHMPKKIIESMERCVKSSKTDDACDSAKALAECVNKNHDRHGHKGTKQYLEMKRTCLAEFDMPMKNLNTWWFEVPEDKKCYYKCMAVKSGSMNEDGQFTVEIFKQIHQHAPQDLLENLEDCSVDSSRDNPCDSAKALAECMHKKHSEKYGEPMEKYFEVKKVCLEKFNLPSDNLNKWWFEVPESKKCYYNCMTTELGSMNKDGEFTIKNFKTLHPEVPEKIIKHLEECTETSKRDDPCDTAKALTKCMRRKHQSKHGKCHERDRYFQIKKQCLSEFELPLENLRKWWFDVPEDKKCYYKCVSVKIGTMNEDGDFIVEKFKEAHPEKPKSLIKNLEECAASSESVDPCDSAKALAHCLHKTHEAKAEKIRKVKKQCLEEYELPLDNLNKWWFEVPDAKKCFYKCMGVKLGSMNEDGEFTIDHFKELHPDTPNEVIENLEECAESSVMDDACDSAKVLAKCLHNKHHHHKEQNQREKYMEVKKECLQKFDLPLSNLKKWWFDVPDDKKCYYKCMTVSLGSMNKDGEFTMDRLKELHPTLSEELLKHFEECTKSSKREDQCDSAKALSECMHKKHEKDMEKYLKIKRECLTTFNLPIENLDKWVFHVPDDKKCYYQCMATKFQSMNEDGEFTIDRFAEANPKAPKELIKNMVNCAEASKKDDACDSAEAWSECLLRKYS